MTAEHVYFIGSLLQIMSPLCLQLPSVSLGPEETLKSLHTPQAPTE